MKRTGSIFILWVVGPVSGGRRQCFRRHNDVLVFERDNMEWKYHIDDSGRRRDICKHLQHQLHIRQRYEPRLPEWDVYRRNQRSRSLLGYQRRMLALHSGGRLHNPCRHFLSARGVAPKIDNSHHHVHQGKKSQRRKPVCRVFDSAVIVELPTKSRTVQPVRLSSTVRSIFSFQDPLFHFGSNNPAIIQS